VNRRIVSALIIVILSALTTPARAADPPSPDVAIDEAGAALEEVVVLAAKRPQPLREAAASSTVITAADLAAFGWRDFAEAIGSLAGFYTNDPRDTTYIGVRGIGLPGDVNGRILILVDGHEQQELWSHSAYPEQMGLDAALIDHIEVLRGPASALYGSLGFLAIINVVTKRPTEHDWARATVDLATSRGLRAAATAGHRFGSGLELSLALSGTLEAGQPYRYPDLAGMADTTRPESDAATGFAAYGHLAFRGLTVRGSYQVLDKHIPFAPYGTIFDDPTNHFLTSRGYLDVGYQAGRPEAAQVVAHARFDTASYVDDLAYGPDQDHAKNWLFHDEAHPWCVGADLKLLAVREQGDRLRAALTLGGDFTYFHGDDLSGEPGSTPTANLANDLLFGAFLGQAEVTLARKLILTVGARADLADHYPSEVSPRAALVLLPYPAGTWKLLYNHGFIHPSWYETFFDDRTSVIGNPNLRPERVDHFEIVYQHQIGRAAAVTASLFYIHGADLLEQRTVCLADDGTIGPAAGCATKMPKQTQNARSFQSAGAELGISARLLDTGRLYANWSWAHASDEEGLPPVNSPEHQVKAGLSLPVWRDHLFVGAEVRYRSAVRLGLGSLEQGGEQLLLSALVSWRDIPKGLTAQLKVYDVTAQPRVEPSLAEDSRPIVRIPHGGPTEVLRLSYGF
jgi:outer membrane receptor for ferrienterochelin and colicin